MKTIEKLCRKANAALTGKIVFTPVYVNDDDPHGKYAIELNDLTLRSRTMWYFKSVAAFRDFVERVITCLA